MEAIANRDIDAVRAFNRFYTGRIGLLQDGLLDSGYSLTEVRLLYEISHAGALTLSDLARDLSLDLGYLSRLVKRLHARGLLSRKASTVDRRRALLQLTAKGRKAFGPIEAATDRQVGSLLDALPVDRRDGLLQSMATIRQAWEPSPAPSTTIREPRSGDFGWVIRRQGMLYAQEYGWGIAFEALVAEIVGAFGTNFDPAFERCWIAEQDGAVVGSVFVVRRSARVAQLRLLYVEPSTRGQGIGSRLVDECIAFAKARGYRSMMLWTNDVLASARKIYQAAGFVLVSEERHRSFGKDLVGQNWSLKF